MTTSHVCFQGQQRFFDNPVVISSFACSSLHRSFCMQCTCTCGLEFLGLVSISQCSFVHIWSIADTDNCGNDHEGDCDRVCQNWTDWSPHMFCMNVGVFPQPRPFRTQRTCTPRLESLGLVSISPCFFAHMQRMLGIGSLGRLRSDSQKNCDRKHVPVVASGTCHDMCAAQCSR